MLLLRCMCGKVFDVGFFKETWSVMIIGESCGTPAHGVPVKPLVEETSVSDYVLWDFVYTLT